MTSHLLEEHRLEILMVAGKHIWWQSNGIAVVFVEAIRINARVSFHSAKYDL